MDDVRDHTAFDDLRFRSLEQALKNHAPSEIVRLGGLGQKLLPGEFALKMIVHGFTQTDLGMDCDQSPDGIRKTLRAASAAGIDVKGDIDGEPAAFYVARFYAKDFASNDLAKDVKEIYGLTPDDQLLRMKVYAEEGIDFTRKNSRGEGVTDVVMEAMRNDRHVVVAQKTYARETEHNAGDSPNPANTLTAITEALEDCRNTSKANTIRDLAAAAIARDTRLVPAMRGSRDDVSR